MALAGLRGDTRRVLRPVLRSLKHIRSIGIASEAEMAWACLVQRSSPKYTPEGAECEEHLRSKIILGSDDSPRLKPGASGMTLVCRPTPLVRFHAVERTFLTDSPLGWHLFTDGAACTRRND